MSVVTTLLRRARKVVAGAVPATLVAGLGLPALGAVVFLTVLVTGAACWVVGSGDRAERVSRILLAWRGDASCLTRDSAVPPAVPAERQDRRFRWRRP